MKYNNLLTLIRKNNCNQIRIDRYAGTNCWEREIVVFDANQEFWAHDGCFRLEILQEDWACVFDSIQDDKVVFRQYGEWDHATETFIPNYIIGQCKDILKKCANYEI